ncbi:hypothetical protein K2X85_05760 [bacterium]|jgi:hypothetical protein|nr:hypothetical protein [bacterium]
MNNESRPWIMAGIGAAATCLALFFTFNKFVTEPIAVKRTAKLKAEKLADEALERQSTARVEAGELDSVAKWALPGDPRVAVEEYQAFLIQTLQSADIPNPTVTADTARRVGKSGELHVIPFTVTAETDIWSLTKLLHALYLAPRLHQVLDLSLTPVDRKDIGPALRVSLSLEAVSLGTTGVSSSEDLAPFDPPVDIDREAYSNVVEKNVLFATGPGSAGLRANDPEHVVLTFIVQQGANLEADLFDRAQNAARRVRVGEELTIGRVRAVVVDMGLRDMVLKIDGNLYLWQNGSTFSSRTLLSAEEALDREVRNRKRMQNMN